MAQGPEFEAVEFVEPCFGPGESFPGTLERRIGVYDAEREAITAAREAWRSHRASGSRDVAWWVVRIPGETMVQWIADSRSSMERVLDLRSHQLIEVPETVG